MIMWETIWTFYLNITGLFISFHTLEMICFWWTGSPQLFFWENTKWKKISYPHYLKIVIKLSKDGLSYSLKRDLRSISKITFCANSSVKSYWYRALFFSKNCIFFPKLKDCQANPSNWPHSDQYIADLNNKQQFLFEKF